eukprot:1251748-Amphidinium_carterae.1
MLSLSNPKGLEPLAPAAYAYFGVDVPSFNKIALDYMADHVDKAATALIAEGTGRDRSCYKAKHASIKKRPRRITRAAWVLVCELSPNVHLDAEVPEAASIRTVYAMSVIGASGTHSRLLKFDSQCYTRRSHSWASVVDLSLSHLLACTGQLGTRFHTSSTRDEATTRKADDPTEASEG